MIRSCQFLRRTHISAVSKDMPADALRVHRKLEKNPPLRGLSPSRSVPNVLALESPRPAGAFQELAAGGAVAEEGVMPF